jgi:acetyltransferase
MIREWLMGKSDLHVFMEPRSVAVIGVTRKPGKESFNVIENMLEFGFRGPIYPVNPMADEIMGMRAYREVKEIGKPIDLAIVSTPRDTIPAIVGECASLGVKGAIVVSQGFADADSVGKSLQNQLTRISRERGIRILGPNTLGVSNAFSGFTSSFMPLQRERAPVGVVCQSGMFFVGARVFTGQVGKGIDIGNGCDVDFADALEYFEEDPEIRIIFVHAEGLKDGRRFFQVAQRVSGQKPIIAMKTARTQRSARAAASHSGSMTGDHEVCEAAFRQAGVISARDSAHAMDLTKILLHLPPMEGNRMGLITFTGGGGIMLIDSLQEYGLELSDLSPSTIRQIKDLSPEWMPIQNPLDIWPALMKHGLEHVYGVALEAMLGDANVDGVICIAIAPDLPDNAFLDATGVIQRTAAAVPQKPVVAWLYGPNQPLVSERLEEGGKVMTFPTLPRAARALAALWERGNFLRKMRRETDGHG